MVHSRQHSNSYGGLNKDQASISPSLNSPVATCGYSPSSMYPTSPASSGIWPIESSQSYNPGSIHRDDYQRRWQAHQDAGYRSRDRRSECRLIIRQPSIQTQLPVQQNLFPPNFMASSNVGRPQTFQAQYSRSSSELQGWEDWNVGIDSPSSINHQIERFIDGTSNWNSSLGISNLDPQPFDNIFSSDDSSSSSTLYTPPPDQAIPLNGHIFPHRISPAPSPSPSPVQCDLKHSSRVPSSPHYAPRRGSDARSESGKSCSHCHATSTPLWRRDPSTMKPLCNACGLYLQQRNKLRPQELIDADDDGSTSDESDVNYVGPECSHCRTHHTSVWRRSKSGDQLCNACGVYARLRGKPRPLSLKKNKIRPRSKHCPK